MEINSMEGAEVLLDALSPHSTRRVGSFQDLALALQSGAGPALVELPWGEKRDGELYETHQLVLTRVEGDRVYFINALKSQLPEGTVIVGMSKGPIRRVEPHGEESMTVSTFVELFDRVKKALVQNPQ
jgi:hypothetical protein